MTKRQKAKRKLKWLESMPIDKDYEYLFEKGNFTWIGIIDRLLERAKQEVAREVALEIWKHEESGMNSLDRMCLADFLIEKSWVKKTDIYEE